LIQSKLSQEVFGGISSSLRREAKPSEDSITLVSLSNPEALDFWVASGLSSGYLFWVKAMIEELLQQEEGKTLEFKENCKSLDRIIHTIIAFANTAGGKILIGVKDKTKEIAGLQDPVEEELRLANAIADSIEPLFNPDIQVVSWRNREFYSFKFLIA